MTHILIAIFMIYLLKFAKLLLQLSWSVSVLFVFINFMNHHHITQVNLALPAIMAFMGLSLGIIGLMFLIKFVKLAIEDVVHYINEL